MPTCLSSREHTKQQGLEIYFTYQNIWWIKRSVCARAGLPHTRHFSVVLWLSDSCFLSCSLVLTCPVPPPFLSLPSRPAPLPHQRPEPESSTSDWVMSNLHTSLSLCVSFYLPSILNRTSSCQRITPPVCVPVSGLWFPAWLWLWSWPSMPYRSARRRKKRSSTHKLIPKAEGVISETDIKKAESLGSWHKWHLWMKKKKKKRRRKILQLWICCSFAVLLRRTTTVTKHIALKRSLCRRGHESSLLGTTLRLTDTKTWRTEADHVRDFCTFLTGRGGMNNIIKRRHDWQSRNCWREKRNEQEVNGLE